MKFPQSKFHKKYLHSLQTNLNFQNFIFSAVDDHEDNDLLEWESQDLEEKYFDDEEPEVISKQSNDEGMDL